MKYPRMLHLCGGIAALALLLMIGSPLLRAQTTDSEQISKLFTDARSYALLAETDADRLDSYTRSSLAWQTHAAQLTAIKENVNELGKIHKQLSDLRPEGSPWQQEAIDRIEPLLRDMADNLTATINHLNEHKNQVNMQPYRDYAHANYELASRTATLISDIVEYDKSKSRAQSLEKSLELPASGQSQ